MWCGGQGSRRRPLCARRHIKDSTLVWRLEMGGVGNSGHWHRFPDPHIVQVIVKLPSALKTGDVGISGLGPRLMEGRYRSGDPLVAATTKHVQHGVDHVLTLQTEAEGKPFTLV